MVPNAFLKLLARFGAVTGIFLCFAGSAVAQMSATDPTIPYGYGSAALGAEVRFFSSQVNVTSDFNGNVLSSQVDVNSIDPGIDAYITFPVSPETGTSVFAGAWAAPTASIDVFTENFRNINDVIRTQFEFNPNLVSGFLGIEQVIWALESTRLTGRAYAGGRLSSWDFTATGAGNGAINFSDSGIAFVPAGGFDLGIEYDKPDDSPLHGFTVGAYAGLQMQGGYDINNTYNTIVDHRIDVDTGITAYGGLRIRRTF
jgi:hypothetical protein